jgi:hypothetical protein
MEEAPGNGKESSHSAHVNGIEWNIFCMVMLAFFRNTIKQNFSVVKTHLFKLEVCQPRIYLFRSVFTEFL